jgi:hypothetical protein
MAATALELMPFSDIADKTPLLKLIVAGGYELGLPVKYWNGHAVAKFKN